VVCQIISTCHCLHYFTTFDDNMVITWSIWPEEKETMYVCQTCYKELCILIQNANQYYCLLCGTYFYTYILCYLLSHSQENKFMYCMHLSANVHMHTVHTTLYNMYHMASGSYMSTSCKACIHFMLCRAVVPREIFNGFINIYNESHVTIYNTETLYVLK